MYDKIADTYDGLFMDEDSIRENNEVGLMLPPLDGIVCDIGCGTGLLADISDIEPNMYVGCDPSEKMIAKFKQNHPEYTGCLRCSRFEDDKDIDKYGTFVSLFGSCSYVEPEFVSRIACTSTNKFLMFYKPGYIPVTYKETGVNCVHYAYYKEWLEEKFVDCNIYEYHNYIIVKQNIKSE